MGQRDDGTVGRRGRQKNKIPYSHIPKVKNTQRPNLPVALVLKNCRLVEFVVVGDCRYSFFRYICRSFVL